MSRESPPDDLLRDLSGDWLSFEASRLIGTPDIVCSVPAIRAPKLTLRDWLWDKALPAVKTVNIQSNIYFVRAVGHTPCRCAGMHDTCAKDVRAT